MVLPRKKRGATHMPFRIGPLELVIILLIVVAIFGAGKLANLGGSVGKAVKDFRSAVKDETTKDDAKKDATVKPADDVPAKNSSDTVDKPS
jgi:sec-independent protein translocase protein TatA